MTEVKAYAAKSATDQLSPYTISRRDLQPNDVGIDIEFCGICHSDVHQVRNEWGGSKFPMVPGHEITGTVNAIGANVTRFKVGDKVGVGCFIDSCRECSPCKEGLEQYCEKGMNGTYNSMEKDGVTPTYGGYSKSIVVDENYILKIPANLALDKAAPLLCAGVTTYSPLRHWNISKGDRVAVVGLGGLGHMGVKLAAAMGAEVSVLSTSDRKKEDALRFGAKNFINTKNRGELKKYQRYFKFMINTASDNTDLNEYAQLLDLNGTMVLVGAPAKPNQLKVSVLIGGRRSLAGSLIGGIKETQEMLDFCGKHNIESDIEVIAIDKVNEAYERMLKSDVRYRFVIDLNSL